MKSGATNHPKIQDLAERMMKLIGSQSLAGAAMRFPLAQTLAVGTMERLWHFTAQYAPAGDIGRFSQARIADAIGWPAEQAAELIQAMKDSTGGGEKGLLEEINGVLLVHHWSEHADNGVHNLLARRRARFADGAAPNLRNLPSDERNACHEFYHTKQRHKPSANRDNGHAEPEAQPQQQPHKARDNGAAPPRDLPQDGRGKATPEKRMPLPLPKPLPAPEPVVVQDRGSSTGSTADAQPASDRETRTRIADQLVEAGCRRSDAEAAATMPHVTPDYAAFVLSQAATAKPDKPGPWIAKVIASPPTEADGWEPWHRQRLKARVDRIAALCSQAMRDEAPAAKNLIQAMRERWPELQDVAKFIGQTGAVRDEELSGARAEGQAIPMLKRLAAIAEQELARQ